MPLPTQDELFERKNLHMMFAHVLNMYRVVGIKQSTLQLQKHLKIKSCAERNMFTMPEEYVLNVYASFCCYIAIDGVVKRDET